jgi:putative SOS response-associated peptidase YedK
MSSFIVTSRLHINARGELVKEEKNFQKNYFSERCALPLQREAVEFFRAQGRR